MKRLLGIVVLLALPAFVFANGGPVDGSEIFSTGNVQLLENKDISLVEEDLQVKIVGDHAQVNVKYLLSNNGEATKVTYGFPVIKMTEAAMQDISSTPLDNLTAFSIKDNGRLLKIRKHKDPKPLKEEGYKELWWHVAELSFSKGERKRLQVSYRIKNFLEDTATSKDFRTSFSDRTFEYLLKPSGAWGTGIVKKLVISVDASSILPRSGKITQIKPAGYKVKNGIITWRLENVNLRNMGDLKVVYDYSAAKATDDLLKHRLPKANIKRVTASISLKDSSGNDYSPENLLDGNLSTAWCVKGGKGRARLTIGLNNARIFGVGIVNGYTKNEKTYTANSRLHRVSYLIDWIVDKSVLKDSQVELPKRTFDQLNPKAVAPFVDWIVETGDIDGRAKSITLFIDDMYPGTTFNDTCISELYLYGAPADRHE